MRTKYRLAFVGGLSVGAVVSGVLFLWLDRGYQQEPDKRALGAILPVPADQVDDDPAGIDRQTSDLRLDDGPISSDASVPPPPFLLPLEKMQSWSMLDHFEQRLRTQAIDSQWAPRMEARLYEILTDVPIPLVLVQLHCRTTMCRLELGYDITMAPQPGEPNSSQILEPFGSIVASGGWRIDAISYATFGNFASPWSPGDSNRTLVVYFHRNEGENRLPRTLSQDVDGSDFGVSQGRIEQLMELRDALFDERRREMESSQDP